MKLKVVYLPPEGQLLEEEEENVGNLNFLVPDSVRVLKKKSDPSVPDDQILQRQLDAVRQHSVNGNEIPDFGEQNIIQVQEDEYHHDAPEEAPIPPVSVFIQPPIEATPPPFENAPEPVVAVPDYAPPVVYTTSQIPESGAAPAAVSPPDLSEDLMLARAEIERLRSLLAAASPPPELRKRTRRLSDDITIAPSDVGTMIEDPPMAQEGVPLQVVVIISLGVFIMTYLFF